MRARLLLFSTALPACWRESHLPSCTEPAFTELGDDEESPSGMTANDLLAIATPGWEGTGIDANDADVDVAWTLERGEGSAVFADIEETTIVIRRRLGFGGDFHYGLHVVCDDWLEVPARISIVSEAAGIDHEMAGALTSPRWFGSTETGVDVVAVEPYEDAGIAVSGIDESFDEHTIQAWISKEVDGRSSGSLSWNGVSETRAQTIYILSWSDYDEAE
jgi:hypothetical protein